MKLLRLFSPSYPGVWIFLVFILFLNLFPLAMPLYSQAIIIDHNCTDVTLIPASWINAAKSMLRCSYGHTSHGSQLISGMTALMNDPGSGNLYNFNTTGAVSAGVLSIADYTPSGDLGNPDRTEWEARTRSYLDGSGSDRNVVMWSWCGQVSSASANDINTYLTLMDGLEQDYPDVTFVYMTGHLDGTGESGNLNVRNNQIRAWCQANNKVLFDFADIESYDPDGNYFLDLGANDACGYSGGNWADEWIAANPDSYLTNLANSCGSCAHSRALNCILKGNATWWLMARIAGWNGIPSTQPTITVTSPNGGENWTVGSSHTISWATTGTVGNVKIEYSINNGGSWTTITSSTTNNGAYAWTIPDTPSDQCLVKISETDGSPSDTGNAVFSISGSAPPSTITVKSPNGGEDWTVGSSHTISWTTTGTVGNVKIEYSINNGGSWIIITSSTANDGAHPWTIPDKPSTQCLVRISETDGSPSDTGDAVFSISGSTPSATITLKSPNGGEDWKVGSSHTITWTTTGTVGNVKIKYSKNNGASWMTITSSTANDGAYSWTIPDKSSTQCLVKISETDGSPSDTSNAVFSISGSAPSSTITLKSPNGGEDWKVGVFHLITWTTTGTVGKVKIKYSINNGGSWTTITSSTANDGAYYWTIPDKPSTQCLVKISETDGSPSDTSNAVFIISGSAPSSTITLKSPNGGEELEVGSSHTITWTTTGTVGDVKIKYSKNNGASWSTITSSTANDGSHAWTIPGTVSSKCLIRIYEASDGSPSDVSDGPFSIIQPLTSELCLNRETLNFGYVIGGKIPGSQTLRISDCGGGIPDWTAAADAQWLRLQSASGKGGGKLKINIQPTGLAAGNYTGTISISDPNAVNSPLEVTVNLVVKEASQDQPPLGSFDTPLDNTVVSGSVPVTGWVVDDVETAHVKVYREKKGKLIYIGKAVFVEGARPDIENSYPDYPYNYRAGWGYMLLTNCLPNQGNGTFIITVIATDNSSNQVTLGSKTIIVDNDNAVKPFGAIDSPNQGGSASGSKFINWGWVLCPRPNSIPKDGSTIHVYVDGVKLGSPVYNIYRADIAGLFPTCANKNGAVGYFYLDTTLFDDGVHTIQWTAQDDSGNSEGIGSRYFTIQNSVARQQAVSNSVNTANFRTDSRIKPAGLTGTSIGRDFSRPLRIKKGYDENKKPRPIYPGKDGIIDIEIRELELIEIHFSGSIINLSPLPIGSTLDAERGIFYWQPGAGFIGEYRFVFIERRSKGELKKKIARVIIHPKY